MWSLFFQKHLHGNRCFTHEQKGFSDVILFCFSQLIFDFKQLNDLKSILLAKCSQKQNIMLMSAFLRKIDFSGDFVSFLAS